MSGKPSRQHRRDANGNVNNDDDDSYIPTNWSDQRIVHHKKPPHPNQQKRQNGDYRGQSPRDPCNGSMPQIRGKSDFQSYSTVGDEQRIVVFSSPFFRAQPKNQPQSPLPRRRNTFPSSASSSVNSEDRYTDPTASRSTAKNKKKRREEEPLPAQAQPKKLSSTSRSSPSMSTALVLHKPTQNHPLPIKQPLSSSSSSSTVRTQLSPRPRPPSTTTTTKPVVKNERPVRDASLRRRESSVSTLSDTDVICAMSSSSSNTESRFKRFRLNRLAWFWYSLHMMGTSLPETHDETELILRYRFIIHLILAWLPNEEWQTQAKNYLVGIPNGKTCLVLQCVGNWNFSLALYFFKFHNTIRKSLGQSRFGYDDYRELYGIDLREAIFRLRTLLSQTS